MCKWFDVTASLAPSESQICLIDKLAPFHTDSKKSLHPALLPDKAFKSSWLRVNAEWHSTSFLLFQNELMDDLWDGNTQTSGQRLGNSFSVGLFFLIKIISSRERERNRKQESTALRKINSCQANFGEQRCKEQSQWPMDTQMSEGRQGK